MISSNLEVKKKKKGLIIFINTSFTFVRLFFLWMKLILYNNLFFRLNVLIVHPIMVYGNEGINIIQIHVNFMRRKNKKPMNKISRVFWSVDPLVWQRQHSKQ